MSFPKIFYFLLAVFLLVLGILSIIEGKKNASDDTTTNIGLLVMSIIVLVVALIAMFWLPLRLVNKNGHLFDQEFKHNEKSLDTTMITKLIALGMVILAVLGFTMGTLGITCSTDTPNSKATGRALLGFGGTVTGISGLAVLHSSWLLLPR
jgi:hypothetical protein